MNDIRKLQQTLQYLASHSPYYKELFAKHNIDISAIQSQEALSKIPFTDKTILAERNHDFICVAADNIVDYSTTSGTTGKPVTIALTENDLQRLALNEYNSFIIAGITKSDIVQLMLTLDRQFMAGMAYYLGLKKIGAAIVRSGPGAPPMQWENIQRFHPTVLVAVPSFILKLLEWTEQNHIDINASSVKKIICIGENIRNTDLTPNTLAKKITSKWNVQLFSTYASTEMQTAFTECEAGCGGHHQPDLIIAEIIDENGKQVKAGEHGELTITTLGVEGVPLLRYQTGDVCTYFDEPCSCGRTTFRISPVISRKNQMIKFRGTTLYPPMLSDALSHFSEINDYVIEVFTNNFNTDEVTIYIELNGSSNNITDNIKHHLQSKLRVLPELKFVSAEALQQFRQADSRKPMRFIDRRRSS
jgi:phenylacetate-CoA ligase